MCCLADNIPPFLAEKYVYKQWLKAFTGGCKNRPIDSKQVKILVCKRRPGHSSLTRTNQKILEFSFFYIAAMNVHQFFEFNGGFVS